MADVNDILKKYASKIESQISTEKSEASNYSKEYQQFKEETMPSLSRYERFGQGVGSSIHIGLKHKDEERINKALSTAHLNITASDVASFSFVILLLSLFVSALFITALYFLTGELNILLILLLFCFSIFLFYYTMNTPMRIEQSWRLKASSQMVPCILYIVVYMRHTSNLERAIGFASEHLQAPLALDFKKIFYDVEIGKYSTIKESLDAYLETWRDYSLEFLESFHLIESSLYEPSDERRTATLEKALEVILDGVYEKMLKYTHDVKAPLTNLYMLGIVLPTLALALLPLASTLIGGKITWLHVTVFFNLIIPLFVFYMTSNVLMKRPGGYGEAELLEQNPDYPSYISKTPYIAAFFLALPFFLIGIAPFLFQFTSLPNMLGMQKDFAFLGMQFFDFKHDGKTTGPFGVGALILSLFIPLAVMLFFSVSYKMKTSQIIKSREETKKLETEFASSIFQLGNRLGDGMPAEIAFARVAESVRGTATENFFRMVNTNINQAGMSVESAIFNPRRGAIIYYPSALIRTSMKILVESVKKSLQVAARALMSISQYVKNIQKINERLRDLLADIISDMRSNMTFLAPILAGIVVGLSIMITTILNKLQAMMQVPGGAETSVLGIGTAGSISNLFNITAMIPPYYLQVIVGIYIIEIVFILTQTLVTIENGVDKLSEKSEISRNLRYGILLYFMVSLISTIALSALAFVAIGGVS